MSSAFISRSRDVLLEALRTTYHQTICNEVLRINNGVPNIADSSSLASKQIALSVIDRICPDVKDEMISGQSRGRQFEEITKGFLQQALTLLTHLRPGKWEFAISGTISQFEQYHHLEYIRNALKENPELTAALGGDYLITPDIVLFRYPLNDNEINQHQNVITSDKFSEYTPLRSKNNDYPILQAMVSCKWTLRSDRSQNVRTEALNLIRNRKGHTPSINVVTAEPLPTRIASLALGTGDLDCVYHFALPELYTAVQDSGNRDQIAILKTMIIGRRLRDISDLVFDLII